MSRDPDVTQRNILTWLLQEPPTTSLSAREELYSIVSSDTSSCGAPSVFDQAVDEVDDLELDDLELLDFEEMDLTSSNFRKSADFSPHSGRQTLKLGEIHTVHDRFHALLKRRLEAEIQRHPPLFPWETEISDYETESKDYAVDEPAPIWFWTVQLNKLNLPVPVPEKILAQLLDQCQATIHSSLREGAKIVRVVESLFPGESQALNQLAGMVLMSASRSGSTTTVQGQPRSPQLVDSNFPDSYEAANPTQQMLLSLLATREIFKSLAFTLSAEQPVREHQWATAAGLLALVVHYQPQESSLRVQAELPCEGRLRLWADATEAIAERSNPGALSVQLFDLQPDRPYCLEVQLQELEEQPLIFSIKIVTE